MVEIIRVAKRTGSGIELPPYLGSLAPEVRSANKSRSCYSTPSFQQSSSLPLQNAGRRLEKEGNGEETQRDEDDLQLKGILRKFEIEQVLVFHERVHFT
jgi:hypothetical protein